MDDAVIGDKGPEMVVPLNGPLDPAVLDRIIDARRGPPFTFRFKWREMPFDMVAVTVHLDLDPTTQGSMLLPTLAFEAFRDVWGGGDVDSIHTADGEIVSVRWEQIFAEEHDPFRYYEEDRDARRRAEAVPPEEA
jgi:hypothetical protein